MAAVRVVFLVGWAAFWLYWFIAAASGRRERGRIDWSRQIGVRVVMVAVVIVLIRSGTLRGHAANSNAVLAGLGLGAFALGLAFAVWARLNIGRNWGTPMTQTEGGDLVTSGPYRLVRHPIYSGILAAGVGTAVGLSWVWLAAVLLAGIYFVYAATVEERFMARQFPDAYPAYRRRTKMLVPFIF